MRIDRLTTPFCSPWSITGPSKSIGCVLTGRSWAHSSAHCSAFRPCCAGASFYVLKSKLWFFPHSYFSRSWTFWVLCKHRIYFLMSVQNVGKILIPLNLNLLWIIWIFNNIKSSSPEHGLCYYFFLCHFIQQFFTASSVWVFC